MFLLVSATAWAGTVRLVNDTSVKLTAVIRAADGTDIGTIEVNSQQTMSWNNYWGGVGNIQYYDASQTPYTVLWFCNTENDTAPFSVCSGVSSGSTVTALSCSGTRACKQPKKKSKTNYPPPPPPLPEQQIQQEAEQAAGPPQGMVE